MKKILTALLCATTALTFAFGFTACSEVPDSGEDTPVKLVAIDGTQVGTNNDIDYFVVPEPAASTKVNAIPELGFVGDLQQLYGGDNGYPQAVIVAKNELALNTSFVGNFLTELNNNSEWLLSESTSADTIVNAVQSHLTEGLAPTFTANNLSKDVIRNCGIKFVSAVDSKNDIISIMEKMNSVSATSFGTPSDNFFWDGNGDDAQYNGTVTVVAPDGAPALGLANLLVGSETIDGVSVNYRIVDSSLIQTFVNGNNPADICVLPVNVAVKLLGSGENYKLIGTLTHGNLFIVSKDGTKITTDNLGSLRGKKVGVVNLAAVPGLTFKIILKENGIDFTEVV